MKPKAAKEYLKVSKTPISRITIRIKQHLADRAAKAAEAEGVSQNRLLECAIEKFLDEIKA